MKRFHRPNDAVSELRDLGDRTDKLERRRPTPTPATPFDLDPLQSLSDSGNTEVWLPVRPGAVLLRGLWAWAIDYALTMQSTSAGGGTIAGFCPQVTDGREVVIPGGRGTRIELELDALADVGEVTGFSGYYVARGESWDRLHFDSLRTTDGTVDAEEMTVNLWLVRRF